MGELFHRLEYIIIVYTQNGVKNSPALVFLNQIIPPRNPIYKHGFERTHSTQKEKNIPLGGLPEHALFTPALNHVGECGVLRVSRVVFDPVRLHQNGTVMGSSLTQHTQVQILGDASAV